MKFVTKMKKYNSLIIVFFILILSIFLFSCHKSPGAICNDGSRSYSTGRGTCSWHGGVDHYIDTHDVSIPKTTGLIVIIGLAGGVFINSNKKSK